MRDPAFSFCLHVFSVAAPFFALARTISNCEQLTDGRIPCKIAASYLESAVHSSGEEGLPEHDARHDMGGGYLEACYKLLGASWDDDAVVKDRQVAFLLLRPRCMMSIMSENTFVFMGVIWPGRLASFRQCARTSSGRWASVNSQRRRQAGEKHTGRHCFRQISKLLHAAPRLRCRASKTFF